MSTRSLRSHILAALAVTALLHGGDALAADPTTADCLAATDSSLALGRQHKLRAERGQLLVCAAQSCPADIRKECATRVEEVNAQIPTVIFQVKDASGADMSAVKVTMDAEVLTERLEGVALSVDPGEHAFTFEVPGQPPITKRFVIVEAQKDRRELITVTTANAAPAAPAPKTDQGLGTQKVLAIVAGAIGVAGVGVGTAFGLVALSKKNAAQSACPGTCANQSGANMWSDAETAGNISTIAFIVGGVGVAGGALLWLTAPGPSSGTQVGVGPGSLQLRGVW